MLILAATAMLGACSDDSGSMIGRSAPDFALTAVDGQTVRLSDHRGKAVIVDFWATWCPPCKALMPDLESLAQQYDGELEIIAVSVDGEPETAVPPFAREHGYTITMTADGGGQAVAREWGGTKGIPCTYLVDGEGIVRFHWLGRHDRSDYDRAIREVLGAG
jgi:thiol-disulfide isomerase/thioredoxin